MIAHASGLAPQTGDYQLRSIYNWSSPVSSRNCFLNRYAFVYFSITTMKSALILASLAAGALALPSDTHTVHQRRNYVQDARFEKRSSVAANAKIPFQIALKQSNLQEAEDKLYDM